MLGLHRDTLFWVSRCCWCTRALICFHFFPLCNVNVQPFPAHPCLCAWLEGAWEAADSPYCRVDSARLCRQAPGRERALSSCLFSLNMKPLGFLCLSSLLQWLAQVSGSLPPCSLNLCIAHSYLGTAVSVGRRLPGCSRGRLSGRESRRSIVGAACTNLSREGCSMGLPRQWLSHQPWLPLPNVFPQGQDLLHALACAGASALLCASSTLLMEKLGSWTCVHHSCVSWLF